MKFFVDTADVLAIRKLAAAGILDRVMTNPSHIAMIAEGERLAEIAANVAVKDAVHMGRLQDLTNR